MTIAIRHRVVAAIVAVLAALTLALAMFPWGLVARHAAGPLAKALGRPVTIGSARRVDWIGFVPRIELRDVRIGQPAWAGGGDMARIAALDLRLPVLPLLLGRVRPRAIAVDGLALHLVRDANGRDNWSRGGASTGGGSGPRLTDLTIRNGRVRLDDARRHVTLDATLLSDATRGLRIDGAGMLRNMPLQLSVAAPAIAHADPARPYPARLSIRSPLVSADAQLLMDHPLDTGHFAATVRADGRDLFYLDDLLQAGLFRTQPFRLAAQVRHDGREWRLPRLAGTVGRSTFTAALDVTKPGGRTYLAGRVDARTLDFDDLASDEQRAQGNAARQRLGPRVIPATRIVLDKLGTLDGRIEVKVATLLSRKPSPFRAFTGVARMDHQLLTIHPVTIALPKGSLSGRAVVDGRGPVSKWTLDLRIAGATIESLFPVQQAVAGPARGRVLIEGSGPTLDSMIATGHGRLALVVEHGSMRRDYATFLGGDLLKSVGAALGDTSRRTELDCLIGSFALGDGRMVPSPLILSTPLSRGDGTGAIALPSETIDLRLVGRPIKAGLLQSTAPVRLFGTLTSPRLDIRPPRARDTKQADLLARVGFLIKKMHMRGEAEAAPATPVSCPALAAQALR